MKLKNQRKVAPDLTGILLNRIAISRELHIFSLNEIAAGWEMSRKTLFRYESPESREYSRLIAKRATEAYRAIDKTLCQICGNKLQGHDRCSICTMLIHDVPECSCEAPCVVSLHLDKLIIHINNK